jgi:seryl-tRNA synthetase
MNDDKKRKPTLSGHKIWLIFLSLKRNKTTLLNFYMKKIPLQDFNSLRKTSPLMVNTTSMIKTGFAETFLLVQYSALASD